MYRRFHSSGSVLQRIIIILLMLPTVGCASYYGGDRYREEAPRTDPRLLERAGVTAPMFFGYGEGASRQEAEAAAKQDALFRSAVVMLEESALLYGDQVQRIIAGIRNLEPYCIPGTLETVAWDRAEGKYQLIAGVRINLRALSDRIVSSGIEAGMIRDQVFGLRLPDEPFPEIDGERPLSEVLFRPEMLWQDVSRPVFLVSCSAAGITDAAFADTATAAARGVLVRYGFPAAEYDQMQQQAAVMDVPGVPAHLRLDASPLPYDYHIEISAETSVEQTGSSRYLGRAFITVTCYDASTGQEIGGAVHQTKAVSSTASLYGAGMRALRTGTEEVMENLLVQISGRITDQVHRGEQYELVFIGAAADPGMDEFISRLEQQAASLRRTSFSLDEIRFVLVFDGSPEELEKRIRRAAAMVPGAAHMHLVNQQENSLIFDAGRQE